MRTTITDRQGNEIIALNHEGYIARDPHFPRKLARIEPCRTRPGDLLLNLLDAEGLRMWAASFNTAADHLDFREPPA